MKISRNKARLHKHIRIRNKIQGTLARPRVCVFKSLKNLEAQLINDAERKTMYQHSTIKMKLENGGNVEAAKKLGEIFGKQLVAMNIKEIVFDRSGYIYHGRIAAFADAVRNEGIKF